MLVTFYILVFCTLIYFLPFFNDEKIRRWQFIAMFLLKIAAGFFLTWIYTHYYPDRQTADVFKYFDDSKIIYSAIQNHHYLDYVKMLCGAGNDNAYFDSMYYNKMNHWYRHYDFGTYNDNHTIIRFNALVMLFSFQNFHVNTVFMDFICFIGLVAFFKTFVSYFSGKEKLLFVATFLVPSLVFWSSGVLKEGILLFSLGVLFYSFFHIFIWRKRLLFNLFLLLVSAWLLLINKNYLLIAVVPALLCFLIVEKFHFKKPLLFYTAFYGIAFLLGVLLSNFFMENDLLKTFSLKQRDFINVSKGGVFIQNDTYFVRIDPDKKIFLDTISPTNFKIKPGSTYMYWKNEDLNDTLYSTNNTDTMSYHLVWDLPLAGSTIHISRIEPNIFSLIKTAPQALYNSLCKPGLFSAKSFMEKISAVENILVLVFLMACVWFKRPMYNRNILALCFFIAITILLLIGYTTPVAGAIMRYKVPILPFLLMCGISILDERKLKKLLPFKL